MNALDIARICHEANRAYCRAIGDNSQLPWDESPEWQRDSAVAGVQFRLDHPSGTSADQHNSWVEKKLEEGWKYGPVKDADKKEHPCMMGYEQLPAEQRAKDALFSAIVDALKPCIS